MLSDGKQGCQLQVLTLSKVFSISFSHLEHCKFHQFSYHSSQPTSESETQLHFLQEQEHIMTPSLLQLQ